MKIIFQQDIKGQAKKGDVKIVSDGYARNYLLPRGLAVEASKGNVNSLKGKKESEHHKKEIELLEAKKLKEKLDAISVSLAAKAGENGKLFGSITSSDIADKLKLTHHIVLDKRKLIMHEGLKQIGQYGIEVRIYPEITAILKVDVTFASKNE